MLNVDQTSRCRYLLFSILAIRTCAISISLKSRPPPTHERLRQSSASGLLALAHQQPQIGSGNVSAPLLHSHAVIGSDVDAANRSHLHDDNQTHITDGNRTQGLPADLWAWKHQWDLLHLQEENLTAKAIFPKGVKMVLGVMSMQGEHFVQDVIRLSWMKQRGVCTLSFSEPGPECVVNVAFVIANKWTTCNPTSGWICNREPAFYGIHRDQLHFDFKENMNAGKTYKWFAFSAETFPWATHIGKLDVDFFPHLHNVVNLLAKYPIAAYPYGYFGKQIASHGCWYSVSQILKTSKGKICMYGMMYIMTGNLVRAITGKGSIWEKWQTGNEDVMAGSAVTHFITEKKASVQVLPNALHLPPASWGLHSHHAMGTKVDPDILRQ